MACIQLELAVAVTNYQELSYTLWMVGLSRSSVTELSLHHAHAHLLLSGNLVSFGGGREVHMQNCNMV